MSEAKLNSVAPMVPTGLKLSEALDFYCKHMGFEIAWQHGSMAGVRRNAVQFNLIENFEQKWLENASFSIGVSDLDALYEQYKTAPFRVGPLEMKMWGRREFHMIVPGGVCLQFFQTPA